MIQSTGLRVISLEWLWSCSLHIPNPHHWSRKLLGVSSLVLLACPLRHWRKHHTNISNTVPCKLVSARWHGQGIWCAGPQKNPLQFIRRAAGKKLRNWGKGQIAKALASLSLELYSVLKEQHWKILSRRGVEILNLRKTILVTEGTEWGQGADNEFRRPIRKINLVHGMEKIGLEVMWWCWR